MVTRLSVEDAAHELGLSQDTIKRRLKRGALRGERERTPSGFRWYVLLDGAATAGAVANGVAPAMADATAATAGATAPVGAPTTANGVAPSPNPERPPAALLAAQRAEDMAVYSHRLLAPYVAQIAEQAERIGHLEERATHLQAERDAARVELEQARTQLAEAIGSKGPPEPQNGATHQGEERRRWWQRLFSWDTAEGGA